MRLYLFLLTVGYTRGGLILHFYNVGAAFSNCIGLLGSYLVQGILERDDAYYLSIVLNRVWFCLGSIHADVCISDALSSTALKIAFYV